MNEKERLDFLLAQMRVRELTEAETEEFRHALRDSPDALDHYLDHCEIETWLTAAGDLGVNAPEETKIAQKPNRRGVVGGLTIAAAAVVALAIIIFNQPEPAIEIATVIEPPMANEEPTTPNPWKVLTTTGSLKHPGLTDTAMPKSKTTNRPIKFNRDIRPILSETCFNCHGPDEHGRRAKLRLDTPEGALAAITPGNIEESEAWWRIISDDPDELMPPPESHMVITPNQKATIKRWIEEGAKYEGHWAFAAPKKETPPAAGNEIDTFVQARLNEEGIEAAKEAPPETLVRRLHLDLVGLPPTPKEVTNFVSDYAARGNEAYETKVTELLASPHFGERMAVPWLDQARYADSNGYSIDGGRDMWLWRDWVIQSYNENKPFDVFLTEQIAGDLLPNATDAQKIATGFNRNHMITHEGGTIPEENLTNYTADRVKTASEVFLALTMACAQCHDHKYDPISQKDYFKFFAFFNELGDRGLDGNGGKNSAPSMMAATVLPNDELAELQRELDAAKAAFTAEHEGFNEWLERTQKKEAARGKNFQLHEVEMLDISSPNRPGSFQIRPDGSVEVTGASAGLNAFSHAIKVPTGKPINGLRVTFIPHAEGKGKLTKHDAGVPRVTAVLVSSGEQQAAQVDLYRQLELAEATASTRAEGRPASAVLDERNTGWWEPTVQDQPQHLTITFAKPVDPVETPFLTAMVFFGTSKSLPNHWKIEAFSGNDTDTVLPEKVIAALHEKSEVAKAYFRNHSAELEPLRVTIANLEERIQVLTAKHSAMVMDTAKKPRETHVLNRGQYDQPREKVTAGTPDVLPELPRETNATRLDLANWMTKPDHPLTARVAVNRIWQLFFGTGFVATSADFGSQGEWPSHPELLDWLAVDFVESGWDQKALIQKIVTSATYRQDSTATTEQREIDPKNRLLARGPRFRLGAEFIRDYALSVSGLMVDRIGGPSVHPYQPPGLWKEVSHFGSTPATKQVFVQDKGEKLYRRSLYTFWKRTSPPPSMSAFDAPNRELCVMQRGVTNTPLQALVTLNDPQFTEAARVFAHRILTEMGSDDTTRLKEAFVATTGRPPAGQELDILTSLLGDERTRYTADVSAAEALLRVGDSPTASNLDPAELAAWTSISTLLLNLSETLTRS